MEGISKNLAPVLKYLESLNGRADLQVLEGLLRSNDVSALDLEKWCCFNDNHYARNKVASGEWFDFYVMCWKPGQSSAIHDHKDSSCAFRILKGVATEIGYDVLDIDAKLVYPSKSRAYEMGEICSAQDGEIHKISNESGSENLITLHIYSPPLQMSVYETEKNVSDGIKRERSSDSPY